MKKIVESKQKLDVKVRELTTTESGQAAGAGYLNIIYAVNTPRPRPGIDPASWTFYNPLF